MRFLVISGDALTDIDLTKVVNFHREKGAMVTLVLKRWMSAGIWRCSNGPKEDTALPGEARLGRYSAIL